MKRFKNEAGNCTAYVAIGAMIIVFLSLLLFAYFTAKVHAHDSNTPIVVDGNPICANVIPGSTELKIDPPTPGNYNDGSMFVRLYVDGSHISYTINGQGADAVIVKGVPKANVYLYNPPSFNGSNLVTPSNPNNNQPYGLSHVTFCYHISTPTSTPTSKATDEPPTPTKTPVPPTSTPFVTPTPNATVTPETPTNLNPGSEPNPVMGGHIYLPFVSNGTRLLNTGPSKP